jgi:hypothetical protein
MAMLRCSALRRHVGERHHRGAARRADGRFGKAMLLLLKLTTGDVVLPSGVAISAWMRRVERNV